MSWEHRNGQVSSGDQIRRYKQRVAGGGGAITGHDCGGRLVDARDVLDVDEQLEVGPRVATRLTVALVPVCAQQRLCSFLPPQEYAQGSELLQYLPRCHET